MGEAGFEKVVVYRLFTQATVTVAEVIAPWRGVERARFGTLLKQAVQGVSVGISHGGCSATDSQCNRSEACARASLFEMLHLAGTGTELGLIEERDARKLTHCPMC